MARLDTRLGSLIAAGFFFAACSTETGAPPDASPTGSDGSGIPVACGEPDRACPAELPFTSGACEGALHCDAYGSHVADCREGRWVIEALCDGPIGGSCLPPLVESCEAPFEGTASATLAVGPFDEDRAFGEGELVPLIFGAQGGAMIRWALHADGAELPECVLARVRISVDGGEPYEISQTMALHCGDSLATLAILTDSPCEMREYAITLRVAVDGLGETTSSVRAMGGLCPRMF